MPHPTNGPVRDKNYDLICVLAASLENSWRIVQYVQDAEAAGDSELAEWFSKIHHNSVKAGEQGKRLLRARLDGDADPVEG